MGEYRVLATDYDGTLASEGAVAPCTVAALERARQNGRSLILVTGRRLPELRRIFPSVGLFHRVVAENGALLYRPDSGEERLLADPPPAEMITRLGLMKIPDLVFGRVIIASRRPHDKVIKRLLEEMSIPLRIIFNKEAVMVLPPGVDKGSGVRAALAELGLGWNETVGIGDAENDGDFLGQCGVSVAVANALPEVRQRASLVTEQPDGAGVVEAISRFFFRQNLKGI